MNDSSENPSFSNISFSSIVSTLLMSWISKGFLLISTGFLMIASDSSNVSKCVVDEAIPAKKKMMME